MEDVAGEVLLHIFSFLGPCSLLSCASVCREWMELARANACWNRHVSRILKALPFLRPQFNQLPLYATYQRLLLSPIPTLDKKRQSHRYALHFLAMCDISHLNPDMTVRIVPALDTDDFYAWAVEIVLGPVVTLYIHMHVCSGKLCIRYERSIPGFPFPARVCAEFHHTNIQWERYHALCRDSDALVGLGPFEPMLCFNE